MTFLTILRYPDPRLHTVARPVAAVVGHDNVIGCQFHPEKSQVNGLRVLENFCHWEGRC